MLGQEFQLQFEENFRKCFKIAKTKNADYANSLDPFKNFKIAETIGLTVEQGILLRMSDKMSRISNLLQKEAHVKDESIEDTLLDLANYANILLIYLQNKKQ